MIKTTDSDKEISKQINEQIKEYNKNRNLFQKFLAFFNLGRHPAIQALMNKVKQQGQNNGIALFDVLLAFNKNPAKSERSKDFRRKCLGDISENTIEVLNTLLTSHQLDATYFNRLLEKKDVIEQHNNHKELSQALIVLKERSFTDKNYVSDVVNSTKPLKLIEIFKLPDFKNIGSSYYNNPRLDETTKTIILAIIERAYPDKHKHTHNIMGLLKIPCILDQFKHEAINIIEKNEANAALNHSNPHALSEALKNFYGFVQEYPCKHNSENNNKSNKLGKELTLEILRAIIKSNDPLNMTESLKEYNKTNPISSNLLQILSGLQTDALVNGSLNNTDKPSQKILNPTSSPELFKQLPNTNQDRDQPYPQPSYSNR